MREIIIITVSIVFVIIMYPIVFPDRSVILYVRDLSGRKMQDRNTDIRYCLNCVAARMLN